MNRREISFLVLGLGAGIVATVVAQENTRATPLASGVYAWEALSVPKPGGSR
jgi:hypothetical protein